MVENGVLFGGRTFSELFVSTNGGISFLDQTINLADTFEPTDFIIAPFFDDLDGTIFQTGTDNRTLFREAEDDALVGGRESDRLSGPSTSHESRVLTTTPTI